MTVNPNKALWEKGDFTRLAVGMRESGEALVKSLGVGQCLACKKLRDSIVGFCADQIQ